MVNETKYTVCALYKFVEFKAFKQHQEPLIHAMKTHGVKGTLLLAHEGVNGTIAGPQEGIDGILKELQSIPAIGALNTKVSYSASIPFVRARVKLKKEIVTMGVTSVDPNKVVGTYVEPKDWNELISQDDVMVIDTRNDYEVKTGTFKGAINPNTKSFRQFPDYAKAELSKKEHKKIAMFCTGGIRCEKSTAYLKGLGFDDVYHLKGGILKYLEEVPKEESLWQGECFVFDERVTVDHDLRQGGYDQCHACRRPISDKDKESKDYKLGSSCPYCIRETTEEQRRRFEERQRQIKLAKLKGKNHRGPQPEMAKRTT